MKKMLKVKNWEYKYPSFDDYDAYRPNIPGFVHEEHYVSSHACMFHSTAGSGYGQLENGNSFHAWFGVSRRLYKCSGRGHSVNKYTYAVSKNDSE